MQVLKSVNLNFAFCNINYTSNLIDELLNEISPEEREITDKRMLLAATIDEAIKAKGWKKKHFAEAMNKVPSEISKWLSGTHNFNTDTLFEIERVLNINLINVLDSSKETFFKFEFNVPQKLENVQNSAYYDFSSKNSTVNYTCLI